MSRGLSKERDRRNAERRGRAAEQRVGDLTRTLRLVANTASSGGEGARVWWYLEWTAHSIERLSPTGPCIHSDSV
jgi:hypothetical protein